MVSGCCTGAEICSAAGISVAVAAIRCSSEPLATEGRIRGLAATPDSNSLLGSWAGLAVNSPNAFGSIPWARAKAINPASVGSAPPTINSVPPLRMRLDSSAKESSSRTCCCGCPESGICLPLLAAFRLAAASPSRAENLSGIVPVDSFASPAGAAWAGVETLPISIRVFFDSSMIALSPVPYPSYRGYLQETCQESDRRCLID